MLFSVLALSCMYLYKTYAVFTEEKHFNVINGTVGDPGDIYFAYYVDNTITREMPKKGTGYTLDTEKSNCTNSVVPTWDDDTYSAILNYENYNATDYTRTKCNLYFKLKLPTVVEKITKLAATDTTNLATDDYGNTRYKGADPNNYVSIDGDIWRIIGVMKDIDDGSGNKSDRVKIIRASSIGDYSWDTSASSINEGNGVNEWSQADLMKLLNPGYESESIGGSLYWNSGSGTCYSSENNGTTSCDFRGNGMVETLKTLISDAIWNTGSNGTNEWTSASGGLTKHFYAYERSDKTGKICSSGDECNDTVARTTTWKGLVGLIYLSDYGYATSGGSTTNRITCLNTYLASWRINSVSDCKNNDWLYTSSNTQLTLSADSSGAHYVFGVSSRGGAVGDYASMYSEVRPVVYLLPSVSVQSGDGSSSNPYVLSGS